jgi:hypothetical protein
MHPDDESKTQNQTSGTGSGTTGSQSETADKSQDVSNQDNGANVSTGPGNEGQQGGDVNSSAKEGGSAAGSGE